MDQPYYTYAATRGIEEIQAGRLTAKEWIKSCIERTDSIDSALKAWAFFDKDRALSQASEIDQKIASGTPPSPLFGAPVGVKDIFNTCDMPTRRGSPVYENYVPKNDARVVARLRWSHGVIAGKTASDEFAVHWPTETTNPHNQEHTPGGSSSGSAAAVASGMVPLALSSQTLGSTIRPSSYCGIYGFKPSFGLLPRTGMFKTTDTLDHVAFMARSIEDITLLLDTMRLKGPDHPFIHEKIDFRPVSQPRGKRKWKIACLAPPSWVYEEEYAKAALEQFANEMRQVGASLTDIQLPNAFEEAMIIHDTIYNVTLSYYFKEEYGKYQAKISPWFKEMVEKGLKISTDEYQAALERQTRLTQELEEHLKPFDVLLTLSAGGEAPKGRFSRNKPDTCLIWTLCRVPALNVPLSKGPQGLPLGAQLIAKRYDDYLLLDFVSFLKQKGIVTDAALAKVQGIS